MPQLRQKAKSLFFETCYHAHRKRDADNSLEVFTWSAWLTGQLKWQFVYWTPFVFFCPLQSYNHPKLKGPTLQSVSKLNFLIDIWLLCLIVSFLWSILKFRFWLIFFYSERFYFIFTLCFLKFNLFSLESYNINQIDSNAIQKERNRKATKAQKREPSQ